MLDCGCCILSAAFDGFEGSRGGTHPPAGKGATHQRVPTYRRLALRDNAGKNGLKNLPERNRNATF